ncbi:MAG: hypothetical protein ABIT08_14745 [Bacteroidia bacterium]
MKTYLYPNGSGAFALIWILMAIAFIFCMFAHWGMGAREVTLW